MSERRRFKQFAFIAGEGVTRPEATRGNPNSFEAPTFKRDFKRLEFVVDQPESDFITTRCYNAAGKQIWDGDHGCTVTSLAVGLHGNLYQSGIPTGISSLMGDSLFHTAGETVPIVTAMFPGGEPKWAWLSGIDNPTPAFSSSGIAATTDGFVYVGLTLAPNDPRNKIAKLSASKGDEISELPTANFHWNFTDAMWRRVRVDGSNNVYAAAGPFVAKWISDVEYWNLPSIVTASQTGLTGFGVSSDGRVFAAYSPGPASPPNPPLFSITDSSVSNLPGAGGGYLTRLPRPAPPFPDPEFGLWSNVWWYGTGTSPSGRAIIHGKQTSSFFAPVAIQEITAAADPTNPTQAVRVVTPLLGGSFAFNESSLAINDSGVMCYSQDRGSTSPVTSHEIRDAGNGLIGRYDHGGAINDCIVLPNGSVIVAGERVSREDFP